MSLPLSLNSATLCRKLVSTVSFFRSKVHDRRGRLEHKCSSVPSSPRQSYTMAALLWINPPVPVCNKSLPVRREQSTVGLRLGADVHCNHFILIAKVTVCHPTENAEKTDTALTAVIPLYPTPVFLRTHADWISKLHDLSNDPVRIKSWHSRVEISAAFSH